MPAPEPVPGQPREGGEKQPRHLYSVRFESRDLWGAAAGAGASAVYVDLFEPYLEAANARP